MNAKQLFLGLIGLSALLAVAGGYGFYQSHILLNEKIDRSQNLVNEVSVQNERLNQLIQLEREFDQLRDVDAQAEQILPDDKQQSEAAAQLFTLIEQAGLQSGSIQFENTTGFPDGRTQTEASSVSNVIVMPANFQVSGSYSQLLQLISNIENNQRIMQVKSLNVSRSEDNNLSFSMQVEVFLRQ